MKTTFMFKKLFLFFTLSSSFFGLSAQEFKVIGYVPNWISVSSFANSFDYSKVTHINYAFQNPNATGNLIESNSGLSTLVTKAHAAGVKVMISLGGGGASENATTRGYYFSLISQANRASFVQKISDYVDLYSLDGVDVDLEGPAINSDYDGFITALAASMHDNSRGKLLSCALKDNYGGSNVLDETLQKFDFINVMAYDEAGAWSAPGQHSSFPYAQTSLEYWELKGLDRNKIVLGLPFYGYAWNADKGNSAYKSYATIILKYPDAWKSDVIGDIMYYNGVQTIIDKTNYSKTNGYAGVMIWELSQDASGEHSLLKAIHSTVLSVSEINKLSVSIYPNPVNGILKVNSDLSFQKFELYDLTGQKLIESTSNLINVEQLTTGIYFLKMIESTGATSSCKVIKE